MAGLGGHRPDRADVRRGRLRPDARVPAAAWARFPDREAAVGKLTDDDLRGFLETPRFTGLAVAALAADPGVRRYQGHALATVNLADEYGFTDTDGRTPDGFRFRERERWPGLG